MTTNSRERRKASAGPEPVEILPAVLECDADGVPTDPKARRAAVRMIVEAKKRATSIGHSPIREIGMSVLNGKSVRPIIPKAPSRRPRRLGAFIPVEKRFPDLAIAADRLIDLLLANGRLAHAADSTERHPRYRYVAPVGKLSPDTAENRRANFTAVVARIADKVCTTPDGKTRAAEFYRLLGAVNTLRVVPFGEGKAVVVPTDFEIDAGGMRLTAATVVSACPKGLRCHTIGAAGIVSVFPTPDEMNVEIDPNLCVPDAELDALFAETPILPKAARTSGLGWQIDQRRRTMNDDLASKRAGIEAFVGERITTPGWKSLTSSARRRATKSAVIRPLIFSILDPDIRAVCLRSPFSTAKEYNWYGVADPVKRLRRTQAAKAYPILAQHLPHYEAVIDEGRPLAVAIGNSLALTDPMVRMISGLTWQRFGGSVRFDPLSPLAKALRIASCLIPEDRPVKRADWKLLVDFANQVETNNLFESPPSPEMATLLRRMTAIRKFCDAQVTDALVDFMRTVHRATQRRMYPEGFIADREKILRVLIGPTASIRRLVDFSEAWHHNLGHRVLAIGRFDQTYGLHARPFEADIPWAPLTKAPFEHDGATMTWLCNPEALRLEGIRMQHCVGGYSWYCQNGISHIASVKDSAGNESTAELRVDGSNLSLSQNYTKKNKAPSAGCKAIVEEFLRRRGMLVNLREVEAERERLRQEAALAKGSESEAPHVAATDENFDELLVLYHDCLPRDARLTVQEWRDRLDRYPMGEGEGDDGWVDAPYDPVQEFGF